MKRSSKFSTPRAIVLAAVIAILMVGTFTVAFATDLGGIRQAATLWIQGQPREALVTAEQNDPDTEVVVEDDEGSSDTVGSYTVTWQDEDGETRSFSGGGVTMDDDGSVRPVTMDEIIDYLNGPSVDEDADGRIIAAWYDQAEDITDRFVDSVCRVALTHDGETVYMIVRLDGDGGYGVSYGNEGFEALEAEIEEGARLEAEMDEEGEEAP